MRYCHRILIVASLCVLTTTAGRAQSSSTAPAKKPATAAKAPAAAFDAALLHPETLRLKAPAEYDGNFVTTAGNFTIKVTRAWAPNGADRFYNLVRHHFYDGAAFFRVLPGFMAQFGMSAYPEVSRAWEQANIKDDPIVQSNHRGFVSFAMAGPNTRTTQVFINFGNNERLDQSGFSAFGMVTDGMEVVDKLYSGYGEGAPDGHGPDQSKIGSQGHMYLEKNFEKLDIIKTARLATPAANPPAAK
jgi:peptidyl-prolyl cis-trans isomerase A (cyclophilin A)